MTNRRRSIPFVFGGSVLLLAALVALPRSGADEPMMQPTIVPPMPASSSLEPAMPSGAALSAQRQRSEALAWGRDPFRIDGIVAPERSEPVESQPAHEHRLTGISTVGNDRRAIIDRQIVRPGDRLASGCAVVSIVGNEVTLVRDDRQITLSLGSRP